MNFFSGGFIWSLVIVRKNSDFFAHDLPRPRPLLMLSARRIKSYNWLPIEITLLRWWGKTLAWQGGKQSSIHRRKFVDCLWTDRDTTGTHVCNWSTHRYHVQIISRALPDNTRTGVRYTRCEICQAYCILTTVFWMRTTKIGLQEWLRDVVAVLFEFWKNRIDRLNRNI